MENLVAPVTHIISDAMQSYCCLPGRGYYHSFVVNDKEFMNSTDTFWDPQPVDEGGSEELPEESAAQLIRGQIQLQITIGILFRRRKVVIYTFSVALCCKQQVYIYH